MDCSNVCQPAEDVGGSGQAPLPLAVAGQRPAAPLLGTTTTLTISATKTETGQ